MLFIDTVRSKHVSYKETNLILEELPAVTEPFDLKVGPSFFSFTGSNYVKKQIKPMNK
jgi:hypothetical protein